jgi:hypothetical protein
MSEMTHSNSLARTREILARTSRATAMAHEANLRKAMDGVEWERRGFLRTLTRRPREAPPRQGG